MQQMAVRRGLSLLMAVVLWLGAFLAGTGLYYTGTVHGAEKWEEVLEDGGRYNGDIELDDDYDGEKFDPRKTAKVNGDIIISGSDITLSNVQVSGDVFIEGDNIELEDVEVSGDIEISDDAEEVTLDNVKVGDDIVVEGNKANFRSVTVDGDLTIEDDVDDSFYGKAVTVKGTVFVNGCESVEFENSTLHNIEVDADEVELTLSGSTKVTGKVMIYETMELTLEDSAVIQGNVTINAESTVTLKDKAQITGTVTVNEEDVEIDLGSGTFIKQVNVKADDVELSGSGTIEALYADKKYDVDIDKKLTIKYFNEPVREGTVIAAGKAGTVHYENDVTVEVPAGATDVEVEIIIRKVGDDTSLPSNKKRLSSVYELKRNPDGKFKKPVTVTIAYQAAQLASSEKPVVYYYDENAKTWKQWGGLVDGNKIKIHVDSFAKLVVLAEAAVQPTPQPTQPSTQPGAPSSSAPAFKDITGHWAEKQIRRAAELGIIKGYQDGTFRPDAKINRFEFAIMLARLKNLSEADGSALKFKDVNQIPSWGRGLIASVVNARLVLGDAAGNFNPTANLTRVQMAVMIARAAGLANPVDYKGQLPYRDAARIPSWARGAVASVTEAGLMSGSGGQFNPNALATRAQVAAVLVRLAERQ